MRLTVNVCPEGHWTFGSIEPGITCGTCGGEYRQDTLVLLSEVAESMRVAGWPHWGFRDYETPVNIERRFGGSA